MRIEDALGCAVSWLARARQKNALASSPPVLFQAYVCDDMPSVGHMTEISALFKFSAKDDPEKDRCRDAALRLLAVCMKAHFFLFPQEKAKHEPYLFAAPDLSNPGAPHYGLCYRIESRPAKTIVCATFDLAQASSLRPDAFRFPVVLTKNSYKWFDKKHWQALESERLDSEKLAAASSKAKTAESCQDPADFPFGHILDVPFELKDYIKPTGAKWADGIRKWYLPAGYDSAPVQEYLRHIEHLHKNDRALLDALHWKLKKSK